MLRNVILEDTVGLYIHMHKAVMYYLISLCCSMYEKHCLTTSCDNLVGCIKTLSLCRVWCVSAPSTELHKLEYCSCFSCGTTDCLQTNYGGGVVDKLKVAYFKNKLWECCCVKFITVLSFM